jgi:alcohol dehydrogenase class IV
LYPYQRTISLFPRLVDDLGLTSTLTEYKVPKEDVPQIAELALGKKDTPSFEPVVRMLEAMY